MNNALNDVAAEFLPQPWFMNIEFYTKQTVQDTQNPRIATLFQEYYY